MPILRSDVNFRRLNIRYRTKKSRNYYVAGESDWTITLYNKSKKDGELANIGHIDLVLDWCRSRKNRRRIFRTHSWIDPKYRNRGLGAYLYSLAADLSIKKGFLLKSSTCPSSDARRTWRSKRFKKLYVIKNNNGLFEFCGMKKQR